MKIKSYRTQLCKHYLAGFCRRGDDCNFAHGSKFLRQRQRKRCFRILPGETKEGSTDVESERSKIEKRDSIDEEEYEFI